MVAQPYSVGTASRSSKGRGWGRRVARRYEIRPGGLLFIAITLFIAIGAVNSQNNLLFWLFGMAVGAILVSGVASGAALMGLRARRIAPRMIESEARGLFTYELSHHGRFFPAFALLIRELPGAPPPAGRLGMLDPSNAVIEHLSPGAKAQGRSWVVARRRGLVQLSRFEVSTTFPFGLFRKSLVFEQAQTVAVTPVALQVREQLLNSVEMGAECGAPRAGRAGLSDEFYALRAYVPGDSPRTIAWRRSAALGELVVRQFAAPTPPRLVLTLHHALSQANEQTRERAIALLASLARTGGALGYSIGLDVGWAGYRSPLGGGARLVQRWLLELAALDLDQERDADGAPQLSRAAGRMVIYDSAQGEAAPPGSSIDLSDQRSWLLPGASLPAALGEPANPPVRRPVHTVERNRTTSSRVKQKA